VSSPGEELSALAADLRTYLQVHQQLGARWPTGTLPSPTPEVGPEAEREAEAVPEPLAAAVVEPVAPPVAEPAAPPAVEPVAAKPPAPPARPTLPAILADLGDCTRCGLHRGRTNLVFGVGNPDADIVFVGEGPGYYEDQQGEPFVGKSGELLDRIITNVLRLRRDEVYICNVVKCRPPDNRDPQPDEVATCSPFLWQQLDAIGPKVVVGLGRFAVQTLLQTNTGLGQLRGRAHPYRGAVLVPTYHPAYLLRNPADKRKTLEDMNLVRSEYARLAGRDLPEVLSAKQARSPS